MKSAAGTDVSKDGFHVCLKERTDEGRVRIKRTRTIKNGYKGYREFLQWPVKDCGTVPPLFVMEATGSYYEDLAYFLHDSGQRVTVSPANKIRHYAKSLNVKTGTDKVDAALIADFGMEREHPRRQPVSIEYRHLRDLCRERLSMKKALSRAKCRLHAMEHAHEKYDRALSLKTEQITFYQKMCEEIEAGITVLTERDEALKAGVDRLTTIRGVGMLTAITVLCETNGFLLIRNIRQAVSHAGPDVEMKESGQYRGKTKITKKGNARIRECLFMPALSAVNRNPDIKSLYDGIVEKNPAAKRKGAVAGMRKLLVLIFVLWKKQDVYDPDYRRGNRQTETAAQTSGNGETEAFIWLLKKRDINESSRT